MRRSEGSGDTRGLHRRSIAEAYCLPRKCRQARPVHVHILATSSGRYRHMKLQTLTPEVRAQLNDLIARTSKEPSDTAAAELLIEQLSALQPNAIHEVERLAGYRRHVPLFEQQPSWSYGSIFRADRADITHAPILMFNKNGFVREAALTAINRLPDSAFFVAALAWRLNDWAEPVRLAAEACAGRVFPQLSAQTIADAAPFLLERMPSWGRWATPPEILVRVLQRPDCTSELASRFNTSPAVSAAALRGALRLALFDDHLVDLSRTAVRPHFRAMILKALLDREVTWVDSYVREWVDKRYGIDRRVPVLGRRPLTPVVAIPDLIRLGAHDPSPLVRRVAARALVDHASSVSSIDQLMASFATDKSPSVRWCMDYLARRN